MSIRTKYPECVDKETGGILVGCMYKALIAEGRTIDHIKEEAFKDLTGVAYNDRVLDENGVGHPGPFIIGLKGRGQFAIEKTALRRRILDWFWSDLDWNPASGL